MFIDHVRCSVGFVGGRAMELNRANTSCLVKGRDCEALRSLG